MTVAVAAVGLAAWTTAHVTMSASLARVAWWRALVAIVVPPLAPWWGWRFGMPRRAWTWTGAIAVYAVGLVIARL